MNLHDFIMRSVKEVGITNATARNIAALLVMHLTSRELELSPQQIEVDDNVFEKILLMKSYGVPEEVMYIVIRNSLDWENKLDIRKFWRELGAWVNKLGMSREEIKKDVDEYTKNLHKDVKKISLDDALNLLEHNGFSQDFIDKLLEYIVLPDDNFSENFDVNGDVVNVLLRMRDAEWSERDIIRTLNKTFDMDICSVDVKKIARVLPKPLIVNKRKISAHDGSVKYVSHISFLKYINPVLKFFTENAEEIRILSNQYKNDNARFAQLFYDLYVNFRGWGSKAPKFVLDLKEGCEQGTFGIDGIFTLRDLPDQETIVNIIIHELMHFEQYLMLINTPDIGITPYAKREVMNAMAKSSEVYKKYDKKSRTVFTSKDFEDPFGLLPVAQARCENEFYRSALSIPYKKITPESSEYAMVKKLADSFMTVYDTNNFGNIVFEYPKSFAEQMAFDVGNAGAVMFRNIIMNNNHKTYSDLTNVLEFAHEKF